MKSPITTHVLDLMAGKPAAGIKVVLEAQKSGAWTELASGSTDPDGRLTNLLREDFTISHGVYRLTFHTADYFKAKNSPTFYPLITIVFEITDSSQHYHVPLLLSPFGYSTYRGS
jgi:5-hydroxyisourate hydrolase